MFIHCKVPKSKKRKVTKTQHEQYMDWLNTVNSMSTNFARSKSGKSVAKNLVVETPFVRQTPKIPSLNTGNTDQSLATKAKPKVYTGSLMKGIATMHKSNAVPVFTDEQAKDISNMRR